MSKITDAVRERVAREIMWEPDYGYRDWEAFSELYPNYAKDVLHKADGILSTQGDIVDGKWVDKADGQYAVKVVDLAEKLPDMELYYEGKKLYFHPESIEAQYYKLAQQDMLSAGFVKEVSRDG